MDSAQLEIENLANLTNYWGELGATFDDSRNAWASSSWPNRCWAPDAKNLTIEALKGLDPRLIIPVFVRGAAANLERELESLSYHVSSELTAMVLPAERWQQVQQQDSTLKLSKVVSDSDTIRWSEVSGTAFGYSIDPAPIQRLLKSIAATIYFADYNDVAIGSALVFRTGDTAGIHQVGILPGYRGRGLARKMMQLLINQILTPTTRCCVLQASKPGLPLYEQLGFERQFSIRNYRQIGSK